MNVAYGHSEVSLIVKLDTFLPEQRAKHRFLITQGHVRKRQRAVVLPGHFLGWTISLNSYAHTCQQGHRQSSVFRCFQPWGKRLLTDRGLLRAKVSKGVFPAPPSPASPVSIICASEALSQALPHFNNDYSFEIHESISGHFLRLRNMQSQ